MGAWGSGPFENDDAADWRYLLVDGGDAGVVAAALTAARSRVPLDLPDAPNAVAAAAVVAAGLGIDVELPSDVRAWLASVPASTWRPFAAEAVQALDRVLEDSELRELWDEAEDDDWATDTRALRDRIAAAGR